MDALFAKDKRLARIMILAHRHLYQKENEHHLIFRSQTFIREKLEALGEQLVAEGRLNTVEEIFNYTCDEIIELVSPCVVSTPQ